MTVRNFYVTHWRMQPGRGTVERRAVAVYAIPALSSRGALRAMQRKQIAMPDTEYLSAAREAPIGYPLELIRVAA